MCGRIVIEDGQEAFSERYHLRHIPQDLFPHGWTTFNGAPTQILPIIVERKEGERELLPLQWGLIPPWRREDGKPSVAPINARAETVFEKPMFRNLTKRKRCIVPVNGFYEWRKVAGRKQPYYVTSDDGELWSFAGLYDETHDEDNDAAGSFTILTTSANELASLVHDRMPVILPRDAEEIWLSPDVTDREELEQLLRPYPEDDMQLYPVSTAVNNTRNNSPELIEPEGEDVVQE